MLGKYVWPLTVSILVAVMGGLLVAAPFALLYQPFGASWTAATNATLWSGIGLAAVALATTLAWAGELMAAVRQLRGEAPRAAASPARTATFPTSSGAPAASRTTPASGALSDDMIRALAAAVLKDLQERTGGSWKEGA
jgi:divalent metal cation (Fe/Co/Zn/Cd) transporter